MDLKVILSLCRMNEIIWCPLILWQQLNPSLHKHEKEKITKLPAWGSPEPPNQGPDAAKVVPGGDHSIVWRKY